MKRCLQIVTVVLLVALLSGCTNLFYTTDDYKTMYTFASLYKDGTAKQAVYEVLGCPDGIKDAEGNYHHVPRENRESFVSALPNDGSTAWIYECYKRPDPADPYRLVITFDAEGNSTGMEFTPVPGG